MTITVPLQYAVRVHVSGDDLDYTSIFPDRDQAVRYAENVFNAARSRMIQEDRTGDWMEISVTTAYAYQHRIDPFLTDLSDNGLWYDEETVDDQLDHDDWIWNQTFFYPDDMPDEEPDYRTKNGYLVWIDQNRENTDSDEQYFFGKLKPAYSFAENEFSRISEELRSLNEAAVSHGFPEEAHNKVSVYIQPVTAYDTDDGSRSAFTNAGNKIYRYYDRDQMLDEYRKGDFGYWIYDPDEYEEE